MINFPQPNSLERLLGLYEELLTSQGKTQKLTRAHLNPCRQLIQFLKEKGIEEPKKVEKEHLMEFQAFLYEKRDFKKPSIVTFIKIIRFFFDFLVEKGESANNIAYRIEILPVPEMPNKQLAHFYTYDEIMRRYAGSQENQVSYCYLNNVKKHLNGFIKFLIANDVGSFYAVTESVLLKYQNFLWKELIQMKETALVARSQIERLRCVIRLFRYLQKEAILKDNPAQNLDWDNYFKGIIEKAKTLPDSPKKMNDLAELEEYGLRFCTYELSKGKSQNTVKMYKKGIQVFSCYLKEQGILNYAQVTRRHCMDYFNYISTYVGSRGNLASNCYKNHFLNTMKLFFAWLLRYEYLRIDPSIDVESFSEQRGLPRTCMNDREVEKLLEQPALSRKPLCIRDKAILEVLFSTGIRNNELCGLNIDDIYNSQGLIRIDHPKGGKAYQRVIPIGKEAIKCVDLYLKETRPVLENGDPKALFVSYAGHRLQNEAVLNIVKKYAFQCGFRKKITPHSFRVTCATAMHCNGADILYVQKQLGHKRITSTERYIRLNPNELKQVHQKCHPRERKFGENH